MKKIVLIALCTIIAQSSAIFSSQPSRKRTRESQECPQGTVHAIVGAMGAGKSERAIGIAHKLQRSKQNFVAFKHAFDDRKFNLPDDQDAKLVLSSRNGTSTPCVPVANVTELRSIIAEKNPSHIIIDEAQFFDAEIVDFIAEQRKVGRHITVTGLDSDFRRKTFGQMGELLAMADIVEKLTAICAVCNKDTYCFTQRLIDGKPARYDDPIIMVGDSAYEPRCINCHDCPKE